MEVLAFIGMTVVWMWAGGNVIAPAVDDIERGYFLASLGWTATAFAWVYLAAGFKSNRRSAQEVNRAAREQADELSRLQAPTRQQADDLARLKRDFATLKSQPPPSGRRVEGEPTAGVPMTTPKVPVSGQRDRIDPPPVWAAPSYGIAPRPMSSPGAAVSGPADSAVETTTTAPQDRDLPLPTAGAEPEGDLPSRLVARMGSEHTSWTFADPSDGEAWAEAAYEFCNRYCPRLRRCPGDECRLHRFERDAIAAMSA